MMETQGCLWKSRAGLSQEPEGWPGPAASVSGSSLPKPALPAPPSPEQSRATSGPSVHTSPGEDPSQLGSPRLRWSQLRSGDLWDQASVAKGTDAHGTSRASQAQGGGRCSRVTPPP